MAELTSVSPRISEPPDGLLERCLAALHWSADDLDPDYPPRLANAGAEHLVLVTRSHQRLIDLDYDFDALAAIMREHGIITLQLIWPKSRRRYYSRNPFAGSGVVEDPATGAAAQRRAICRARKIGPRRGSRSPGRRYGPPSLIAVSVNRGRSGRRYAASQPHEQ